MKDERERGLKDRTKAFALEIIKLYSNLPKSTVAQVIGRQMLRSGTSVGGGSLP
jgi:four helix bundle protein